MPLQQAAMHSGHTAWGGYKSCCACMLEPGFLAVVALQGDSAPDEVKLIPNAKWTLMELCGKSVYPVLILNVL